MARIQLTAWNTLQPLLRVHISYRSTNILDNWNFLAGRFEAGVANNTSMMTDVINAAIQSSGTQVGDGLETVTIITVVVCHQQLPLISRFDKFVRSNCWINGNFILHLIMFSVRLNFRHHEFPLSIAFELSSYNWLLDLGMRCRFFAKIAWLSQFNHWTNTYFNLAVSRTPLPRSCK